MTHQLPNSSRLRDIISENNISLDFLKSSLNNEEYHNAEFNYDNLLWMFSYAYNNFFQLLQKNKYTLLTIGYVSVETIEKLEVFLSKQNCSIGMFSDFTTDDFSSLTDDKTRIQDLTNDEKTLSLVLIKCMVNEYANDMELGREIRRVFNQIKS